MDTRESLEKDGLTWLLVGAVGFFFGFGWVTGPLGWYFGSKLKGRARDAAIPTPDVVTAAHVTGIVTTLLTYVVVVIAVVVLLFVFGIGAVAVTQGAR